MFELATDCYACDGANIYLILILGIAGIALGLYLIDKLKKESKEKKK